MKSTETNVVLAFAVAIGVLLLVLFVNVIRVIRGNSFFFNVNQREVVLSESYELDGVYSLNLSLGSSDVSVVSTNSNKLRIVKQGSKKAKQAFRVSRDSDNLSIIKSGSTDNFCFLMCVNQTTSFKVYLPESYQNKFSITTTSGDIDVVGTIDTAQLNLQSTSGDIEFEKLNVKKGSLVSTSGSIDGKKFDGSNISMRSTSGDIDVDYLSGGVSLKATSGSIDVAEFYIRGNSTISTTSGDIDVFLMNLDKCLVSGNSSSGDMVLPDMNKQAMGQSIYQLMLRTTSGDIVAE